MNNYMKERVLAETAYMLETKKTIREVATFYHISKSTVHKDLNERLEILDNRLHTAIKEILLNHTETRHLRGGESTRIKYLELKQIK
ncbi:MAG: sporulation transcriptional regulator SpoIIID [Bacilli bacterium]